MTYYNNKKKNGNYMMQILSPKKKGGRDRPSWSDFSGLFQHAFWRVLVLQALLWPGRDGHLTMDSEIQNRVYIYIYIF